MSIKIYIPAVAVNDENRRTLLVLTRPFLTENYEWKNDRINFEKWGITLSDFTLVNNIKEANLLLIPFPINSYFNDGKSHILAEINKISQNQNVKAYGYIAGDFGVQYPEFSNILYFRMGGFRKQLSAKNLGFPVLIGDKFLNTVFHSTQKIQLPVVGFCGHATTSILKRTLEILKCMAENLGRFFKNPFNKVYEPLFASAYERAKLLANFENSNLVKTNFIYRERYRAGATTVQHRHATTIEYFDNIASSDYILCVRGTGNFSVRLYETLMMGKTPVFVNTDCLLPFEDEIDWKKHVVWIEWKERKNIARKVSDFHSQLSLAELETIQLNNRALWKNSLSISGMLKVLAHDI